MGRPIQRLPPAELMRCCSSKRGLISKKKKKEFTKARSTRFTQKSKIYKIYAESSTLPAQRPSESSLIRADVSIHDQAIHPLLGHKCIDLCTTDVKASERRAAASVLCLSSNKVHIFLMFQILSKFLRISSERSTSFTAE